MTAALGMRAYKGAAVSGFLAVLLIASVAAGDTNGLRRLNCVQIGVPGNGVTLGPDADELSKIVVVAVKSRLPRLSVSDNCLAILHVVVALTDISKEGRLDAFYGHVSLALSRPATIIDSKANVRARVWWSGVTNFHGPRESARRQTAELVERYVTEFAAAYYEAGNP